REGRLRAGGGLAARLPQRAGAADHDYRADLCLAAGRVGADGDGFLVARHRAVHHDIAVQRRHECRARRHDRRRHLLHRDQHAERPALPPCRSQRARMTLSAETGTDAALRGWLTEPSRGSRLQARAQRAWCGWVGFRSNPIAMAGLLIVVALVLVAVLAPWL